MSSRPLSRRRARIAFAIGAAVTVVGAGTAAAQAGGWLSAPSHDFGAVADSFSGHGTVTGDVLRNDHGATAVVRHTAPADGTVSVDADGSFTYTPKAGFTGTDTFTYSTTDAVQLFKDTQPDGAPLAPLAKVAGPNGTTTDISGEGYGSSLTPVPGRAGWFYGLTDRGPNADAPDGNKSVDPDGKWTVHQKVLPPPGLSDNGEILKVDTAKLPAVVKTVTVTIHVH